jgi:hypothetical protein
MGQTICGCRRNLLSMGRNCAKRPAVRGPRRNARKEALMGSRGVRVAAVAGAVLLATVTAGVQAQTSSRPCRIAFEETTQGGDVLVTRGEVKLGPAMRQTDGSFVIMGSGEATVAYRSGTAGCATAAGSPFTARFNAYLVGEGDSVTVDLAPMTFESDWITVHCPWGDSRNRAGVSAPPSVTLEMRDGASEDYSYSEGSGIHRGGASGRVTMHYCSGP